MKCLVEVQELERENRMAAHLMVSRNIFLVEHHKQGRIQEVEKEGSEFIIVKVITINVYILFLMT